MSKANTRRGGHRILRAVLLILLVLVLIAAITSLGFALYAFSRAPELDTSDIVPDGYRTTVLDDSGELMLTLIGEEANRIYVTLDEIPVDLQNAFVAIEDERFWTHSGVDPRGMLRALWSDLRTQSIAEGASTITQQLIKNNVFNEWMQESTVMDKLERKLQEQYLALQLERSTSKEWILENYLNTINLGGGSWGVETASMRYFGKDVSQLSLSECAVLAAIPQSPSNYDPVLHPDANAERRKLVLDKMLEQGLITSSAYRRALEDDVYERIRTRSSATEAQIFSYFEDAMINQVISDLESELGYSEERAWDLIYRGGLTILTTQDSALQTICETSLNDDSLYTTDAQASVVLIDNETGQVKALVGGRGAKNASLTLNRAVSSVRQPGSTIKILGEYATILERGMATLGTVYDDAPYSYTNGTTIQNASGTYGGMTTIRTAIEQSTNIVALKCFQQVGISAVWNTLQNFGLQHLTEEDKVEALALGGTHGGVTNLELTAAYSAIANSGVYTEPCFYTEVLDHNGSVLLSRKPETHQAVSARTAALLTNAMEGVITRGTGTEACFTGASLAGKSGTTTDYRDLWFVGFSPDFTCGVWGGYDDNSAQVSSSYVKQIWRSVMQQAQMFCSYDELDDSHGLVSCEICTKCGNLAVSGLCDCTLQGDMTCTEFYVPGTEPTEKCSCHIKIDVCSDSLLPVSLFCPSDAHETKVYLKSGTEGTADALFICPFDDSETCSVHTSLWDRWTSHRDDETDEPEVTGPEDGGSYGDGNDYWGMPPDSPSDDDHGDPDRPDDQEEDGGSWWDRFWGWFGF